MTAPDTPSSSQVTTHPFRPNPRICDDIWRWIDKTDPDGCWPWLRAVSSTGYGVVQTRDRLESVPRFIMREVTGAELPDGLYVLHHCDNRVCCNPAHLYLGTPLENNLDMSRRGRMANTNAALSEDSVRTIRRLVTAGKTQTETARMFGIHPSTVSRIVRFKKWSSVT